MVFLILLILDQTQNFKIIEMITILHFKTTTKRAIIFGIHRNFAGIVGEGRGASKVLEGSRHMRLCLQI